MLDRRAFVKTLLADRGDLLVVRGSARRPTTSPPPAIIRSISICGAPWAAPP